MAICRRFGVAVLVCRRFDHTPLLGQFYLGCSAFLPICAGHARAKETGEVSRN